MRYIASGAKAGFKDLKIGFALALIYGLVFAKGMQIFNLPSGVQEAQAADTGFKTAGSVDETLLTQFNQPIF